MKYVGATALAPSPYGEFVKGGGITIRRLDAPAIPTVTPTGGAAGAYQYYVVAKDGNGNRTLASPTATTAVGPTTLDATHYNTISWSVVASAVSYDVIRVAGGTTQGSISLSLAALSIIDNGLAASAYTAPTINGTGDINTDGSVFSQALRSSSTVKVQDTISCGGVIAKNVTSAAFNTMSTTVDTTIYSDSIPPILGTDGAARLTIFGDMLMNSGAPTLTFSIKLNGVTIWADVSAAYGAVAVRMPWRLELILSNNGSVSSQVMGGHLLLNNAVAATTGEGDLGAVSKVATNVYGTASENLATTATISVTVKPSVNNVNVEVTRKFALLEYVP